MLRSYLLVLSWIAAFLSSFLWMVVAVVAVVVVVVGHQQSGL